MTDNNSNGIDDRYESPEVRQVQLYSNFSRYQHFLPQWIWAELMGISPQKRRAFLLEQKFRTPLTFDYAVFDVMIKTAIWIVALAVLKELWRALLRDNLIITVLIIAGWIALYVFHKITQSRNTSTITEELQFQIFSDVFSVLMGLHITFFDSITPILKGLNL